MRISDWSSDVCSSDLFHTRFAQLRVGVCVTVVADDHARLERDNVVAVIPLLAFGDVGVASEIGRASCRERVCQYVYISVVAVSLKKKVKNQSVMQSLSMYSNASTLLK